MIANKNILLICLVSVSMLIIMTNFQTTAMNSKNTVKNKEHTMDYVPDPETASKIAEAIWESRYGTSFNNTKPFKVKLIKSSIWEITTRDDILTIEIRKKDCKIINLFIRGL